MSTDQLRQFFAHIFRDPALKEQVLQAVSADAAALIAQELGYEVSGDELLRFSGKSSSGVSVTNSAPGEYHQNLWHHRNELLIRARRCFNSTAGDRRNHASADSASR